MFLEKAKTKNVYFVMVFPEDPVIQVSNLNLA